MRIEDINVPECYMDSPDFRFFLTWFDLCLSKVKYDSENVRDLFDPIRCPSNLLWMLCDTMGYRYDSRLTTAYNRLVLLYFMSMIYGRGSKNGMTLAAEVNLAQFSLTEYARENSALEDRLEDTSIPVNSVYVTPHIEEGYIDVVYYSENMPIDCCTEYVRPLGMYCFTQAGVKVNARTKISVDARLTYSDNVGMSIGPTHIGHYRRADYAALQQTCTPEGQENLEKRQPVYYRNSDAEGRTTEMIDPGYRSLYSLQVCNNDHIVKSLIPSADPTDPIFSLGYGPHAVETTYPDNYLKVGDNPMYNLRLDAELEASISPDVYTLDPERQSTPIAPKPAVNGIMTTLGDAIL